MTRYYGWGEVMRELQRTKDELARVREQRDANRRTAQMWKGRYYRVRRGIEPSKRLLADAIEGRPEGQGPGGLHPEGQGGHGHQDQGSDDSVGAVPGDGGPAAGDPVRYKSVPLAGVRGPGKRQRD